MICWKKKTKKSGPRLLGPSSSRSRDMYEYLIRTWGFLPRFGLLAWRTHVLRITQGPKLQA